MVYKYFDKNSAGSGVNTHTNNEKLAEELHKTIIKKFLKGTVYSAFKDNIWGVDIADMQLISKFNNGFRFSLCLIDIFSKYTWVIPLKDKKGVTIVNAFQKNYYMIQWSCARIENQTKYGLIKEVSFTIVLLKNG